MTSQSESRETRRYVNKPDKPGLWRYYGNLHKISQYLIDEGAYLSGSWEYVGPDELATPPLAPPLALPPPCELPDTDPDEILATAGSHWVDEETKRVIHDNASLRQQLAAVQGELRYLENITARIPALNGKLADKVAKAISIAATVDPQDRIEQAEKRAVAAEAELTTLRQQLADAKFQLQCDEERASKRGFLNVASPTALYEMALTETEAKLAAVQGERDEYRTRLRLAIINLRHASSTKFRHSPNWSNAGWLFGLGSTSASKLCELLGLNANATSEEA